MGNSFAMTGMGFRGRLHDVCHTCDRVLIHPVMHLYQPDGIDVSRLR
jgi:hypothetical protein